ncbi:MAG: cell division protein FtsZ [Candidatus Promineifilaceae bacterium]|nr:cell division protein FtsZ [Candidatus Promineifilaceae bacterium]
MLRRKRVYRFASIRVVGIGGGGVAAIDHIIERHLYGVDFVAVDSDVERLSRSGAPVVIPVASPELRLDLDPHRQPRHDWKRGLRRAVAGSELVFLVAGLGGQTGSELVPVAARIARECGALVIALMTFPFAFEGQRRRVAAEKAVADLKRKVDTLIVVPSDRLLALSDGELVFHESYRLAGDLWYQSVQSLHELVNIAGLINVDFADVRSIMSIGGAAIIASGEGRGESRALEAAEQATHSSLLEITVDGARGVLFNITGGPDLTLDEVHQAAAVIQERAHPEANIIFGARIDSRLRDALSPEPVRISLLATGCGFGPPSLFQPRHLEQPVIPVLAALQQ